MAGENLIKLKQLIFEPGHFGLFGSELSFGVDLLNLALLCLASQCFHGRLKLGDHLFRGPLVGCVGVLLPHLFHLSSREFLLLLCLFALAASLVKTLFSFVQKSSLRLETIHHNLHPLYGRRGVPQIQSERPDLCQQGLRHLRIGRRRLSDRGTSFKYQHQEKH